MRKFALDHTVTKTSASVALTNNGKNICVVRRSFASSTWRLCFDMTFPKYLNLGVKSVDVIYEGELKTIEILRAMNVAKDREMDNYIREIKAYHTERLDKTLDRLRATRS